MIKERKNVALISVFTILFVMMSMFFATEVNAAIKAQVTGGSPLKNVAATGDDMTFQSISQTCAGCDVTGSSGWTEKVRDDNSRHYMIKTYNKGSYSPGLTMYYNKILKVGKKEYDIRMTVTSFETTANKCLVSVCKNNPNINLNTSFVSGGEELRPSGADRDGSNEIGLKVEIFDAETKEPALLPGVFFAMSDLDGTLGEKAEAWTIQGFTPNNTNSYVNNASVYYKGSTIYGTQSNSNTVWAYAAVDTMRNGGETNFYYSGVSLKSGDEGNYGSSLHFYEVAHTITYESDDNGTISGKTTENVVDYGNPTGSESTPNTNYYFTHWTCDEDVTLEDGSTITAGEPLTLEDITNVVVLSDLTFTAHHSEQLRVDYAWEGDHPDVELPESETGITPGGTHDVDTTYAKGDTVAGTHDGNEGFWKFNGWDHEGTITVNENTTIKGSWSFNNQFDVNYAWEGEHPAVEPPEGQDDINEGEEYTVDTTFEKGVTKVREPKDGQDGYYLFEGWDREGTFEVTESVIIKGTWSFHPLYKITTDVEHGTITENIVDIEENETKQVNFAPDNGYQLKTLTVDGENKNIHQYTDNYVFEQINEDHTIKAVFEKIPELSIIKRADKESVSAGRTVSYTIELAQVNPGAEARDVVVRDSMPEGVKLIVDSLELPHGAVLNSADEDGYSFTLPSLEDGVMYTYSAKTSAEIEGDLVNTVYASGSNVPENKEDSATVKTVKPEAAVEKSVSNETPEYNESFVYTIKMKQTKEGGIMENAVLTDKIPEEIEVDEDSIHVSDQDAEVSFKNNVLTVKKDELLREIVITFNAKATTYEGTIKNVAKLTGSNVADAEDDADITIKEPKVKLTKTINKKNVKKGDTVKYTIVADVTEATAVNARIKDIVPYGIEVQKNSITCNKDGAKIEFKDGVITINFEKVKGKIIFTFKGRVTVDSGKVKNLVSFNAANFSDGPIRANAVFTAKTEEEPEEDEDEVEEVEKERETSQTGDDIMKYCIIGGIALVLLIGALVLRNKSNK